MRRINYWEKYIRCIYRNFGLINCEIRIPQLRVISWKLRKGYRWISAFHLENTFINPCNIIYRIYVVTSKSSKSLVIAIASAYPRFQISVARTPNTRSQICTVRMRVYIYTCIHYIITRTHVSVSVSSARGNQRPSLCICSFYFHTVALLIAYTRDATDRRA